MITTTYRECSRCHTRVLLFRGMPVLNWMPDDAGEVAVTIDTPRRARFLGRAGTLDPLEKRHTVHACGSAADPSP